MIKKISLFSMAGLYILGGLNHFYNPGFYENIMPSYIPFHIFLIDLSGIVEITLGVMLVPTGTRKIAAYLIISMLTVFFIVHIQMLIDFINSNNKLLWIAIARIPLQFILIGWAYRFTKCVKKNSISF